MNLYVIKFGKSALMNSHGFKNCDWGVCDKDTGEVLMCYATEKEAKSIVRKYGWHVPVVR